MPRPQRARPRARDSFALLAFTLLWLVPMACVGYLGGPPAAWPTTLRDLYAVSCLFGPGSSRTSMFYMQVRYADRRGWHDFDESEYFELEPFGHRTRFDRFMQRFGYQPESALARRELAQWLADTHAAHHPDAPAIVAARFLWADREVRREQPPTERWRKLPRAQARPVRQLGELIYLETPSK